MRAIHVGILVSYDYKYLPTCISCIYDYADKITLAIDKNRRTWNGEKYKFDESFLQTVLAKDYANKISVYEDDFAVSELTTMQCDCHERQLLYEFMGSSDLDAWHIQLDSDEYFIDFKGFVDFLHKLEKSYTGKITVMPKLVTIFRKVEDGIIIAEDTNSVFFPVASIGGCRFNPSKDEIKLTVPFIVLHQSWGRDETEIQFKIENWGHNRDFDTNAYFEFWRSVNKYNAPYICDCHPLGKKSGWNKLFFKPGKIRDIIQDLRRQSPPINFKPSMIRRAKKDRRINRLKQSSVGQRIKPIVKYVLRKR